MKRIVFISAFVIFCHLVYAQYDPTQQVQYASPEASALSRIDEIPVDLYTGRVSFDIPLFQTHQGDIPLNISLTYHGNGIRVDEESGFVGLGWTLNAGGCISRIVRGLPDDIYDSDYHVAGFNKLHLLESLDGVYGYTDYINLIKHSDQERCPYALENEPVTEEDWHKMYMIDQYGEKYDEHRFESSPDNYQFYVSGLSGVFAQIDNRIILQTNNGCDVQKIDSTFKISDSNGNFYFFNKIEQKKHISKVGYLWDNTTPYDLLPEIQTNYPSAWWLGKITNGTGDSIYFSYIEKQITHPHKNNRGFTQLDQFYVDPQDESVKRNTVTAFHAPEAPYSLDTIKHKLLSKIDFAIGCVRFYYADDSLLFTLPHLDSINVFAYPSDKPYKRILFNYVSGKGKELLTCITIIGTDSQSYQYNFTYHKPLDLYIDANAYDYWGYYTSPIDGYFPSGKYFSQNILYHGTDRQPNPTYANNNMLQTISYPTGGTANFEWEPHDYSAYSFLGYRAIHEEYTTSNITDTLNTDKYHVLCGKKNHEDTIYTISIQSGRIISVNLEKYYNGAVNDYATCIYDEWYYPTLVIKKNNQIWHTIDITKYNRSEIIYSSVPAGTYTFELHNPRIGIKDNCYDYDWIFNMYGADTTPDGCIEIRTGYYPSNDNSHNLYAGGVRIKRITYNAGSQFGYVKEYEYKDGNNLSSGILSYPPRFGSRMYFCQQLYTSNSGFFWKNPECVTLRSNPLPFVLNTDGHIGYKHVTEITKGTSFSMNKTIYTFQTADAFDYSDIDDTGRFYESFAPADMLQLTSKSYQRGHIISKTEYRDDSVTTNISYDIRELSDIDTLTGAMFTIADFRNGHITYNRNGKTARPYKDLGIVKYRIIPYNKRIASVQKSGGKTSSNEWYTYANNQYSPALNTNMPVTHSFINSAGDTITETYTYLPNKSFVTSCITTCNGKVIDAYRYAYDMLNRVTASYKALLSQSNLPSAQSFDIGNITDTEKTFTYRNNRLSEVTDCHSGQTTVYLWSYNNTYPVAEIKNATYNEVSDLLSESAIQLLRTSFCPNMDAINALRSSLPNSLVTTRTFAPLVGVTSETDAAGNTTYYDYDGLGRLHRTYIMNGNNIEILKQYEYHLSN